MTTVQVYCVFEIELEADALAAMLLRGAVANAVIAADGSLGPMPAPAPAPARSARAARAEKANGATAAVPAPTLAPDPPAPTLAPDPPTPTLAPDPPAPTLAPTIPLEADLRPLLSRMAAVHVDKTKGVTNMLERVGGSKRLIECPPDTWPAIKQACDDAIAAAGG